MTTPLRQRMIDDLKLAGYSERTQEAYVASVRKLSEHYSRSPDLIDEEELRRYFLYLKDERKLKRGDRATARGVLSSRPAGIRCAIAHEFQSLPAAVEGPRALIAQ